MDLGWEMAPFREDQHDKISAENGRLNLYRDPFLIDTYYEEHAQCSGYDGEMQDSYHLQRHYSPVFGQHYHEDQALHPPEEPWSHSLALADSPTPNESRESTEDPVPPASSTPYDHPPTTTTSGSIPSAAAAKSTATATPAGSSVAYSTGTSSSDAFVPMAAICPICGHRFYDDIALATHIVVHDGVKIAHCQLCGRRMKPDSLVAHYNIYHPGEQPKVREGTTVAKTFKCSDCPMWFASTYNYRNHAQRKHGKRRHECRDCGETFDDREERREHQFVAHGKESRVCEKTYKCSYCPLRFATVYTCRNHAKKKHGKKRHECPECDESFDSTNERREHRLVAHGKVTNMHRPDVPLELRRINRTKKPSPAPSA